MNQKAISILLFLVFFLPLYSVSNSLTNENQEFKGWASESSKNWHVTTPLFSQETILNSLNPLIPSPYGEFDPLTQESPVPKLNFADSEKLAILQLNSNNGEVIFELSKEYGFIPLDRISTNVWMIKKTSSNEQFSKLEQNLEVRWVNYLPIGWKLHPLLYTMDYVPSLTLVTILSSDLDKNDVEFLEFELIELGIDVIYCSMADCVVNIDYTTKNQLENLLIDDRLVWIEPSNSYVLTNAQAREQSGVQTILSNWNSGLNGSGEIVSVVDTGIDMDHSDYTSQLIAVQNGFGLDNNPSDSLSGHGTHVTGTLLGDGSGESEALGIAPAATLDAVSLAD